MSKKLSKKEIESNVKAAKAIRKRYSVKSFIIGENALYGKCEYCGKQDEELRPYGKKGAKICYDCGQKPENKAEVLANMGKAMGF